MECTILKCVSNCQQVTHVNKACMSIFLRRHFSFPCLFSLQTDDDNLTIYGHRLLKNRCLPTYSWGFILCGWLVVDVVVRCVLFLFYLGSNIYKEEGEVMNQTLDQKITSMWAKNLTRYYMLPAGPAL